jgi:hypothetical protein
MPSTVAVSDYSDEADEVRGNPTFPETPAHRCFRVITRLGGRHVDSSRSLHYHPWLDELVFRHTIMKEMAARVGPAQADKEPRGVAIG